MTYDQRRVARRVRDDHWMFMERLARYGVVHVCPWAKNRSSKAGPNEAIEGLLGWNEFASWLWGEHRPWFGRGTWDERRQTWAYWLTAAGRSALRRRSPRDDALPVYGGLVEPGWSARPRSFYRDLHEQRLAVLTKARGYRPTRICHGERVVPREVPLTEWPRKRKRKTKTAPRAKMVA